MNPGSIFNPKGRLTNIPALYQSFMMNADKPLWSLYHGIPTSKGKLNLDKIGQNHSVETMEESWNILLGLINSYASHGGKFTVHQSVVPFNSAGIKHYLDLANPMASMFGVSGVPGVSGIGNMPGMGMMPQQYQAQQGITPEEMQKAISDAVGSYKKDREIEDLKAEIQAVADSKKSKFDNLFDKLLDFADTPAGEKVLVAVAGKILGPEAAKMTMAGFDETKKDEGIEDAQVLTDEAMDELIEKNLGEIEKVIPLEEVLPVLANWVKLKSPEEVRKALKFLM